MPKLPPIVKTNHVSLATALAYNPPNPGHNHFADLEIKQNLGPKAKKPDFASWGDSYCHFYNYEEGGLSYTSEKAIIPPPTVSPPSSLRKRQISSYPMQSTPLRKASSQIPTALLYDNSAESEGSSREDYEDTEKLFGAW